MPLALGTRLGRYEVAAAVGAGGMGEVYRAHDTRLDRDVAIKVLPEHLKDDSDALERLRREAKAIAALSHPNILAIHDFGSDQGIAYAVMELLDGQTLRQRLAGAALPWPKAVEIAAALCEGLTAAHAKGIIHRDLKPENVVLAADGRVKILDFGVAQVQVPQPEEAVTVAQAEPIMGTPGYLSPEQLRGEPARPPSDIFALGAVLYEMLSGRRAFRAETTQETLTATLRDDPEELPGPGIPGELRDIVFHCLEKDPLERFQSARDVAFALKTIQRGGPSGRPAPRDSDSVAVLPFANLSDDADVEYLGDGVTETLINSLTRLPGLRVTPRSTSFRYKHRDVDPQAAGRELGVRVVVTGRIVQRGNTLVVGAELIDVIGQSQLWGGRFTRRLDDIFAIEEELAGKISESLRGALTRDDQQRLTRRPTEDSEAYRLYLRGRHAFFQRTPDSLARALQYFDEAIARDRNYALAYSGVCDAYSVLAFFGGSRSRDVFLKCREAATRAVAIDDGLAEGHASLGVVRAIADWDWPEAEREFRRAIEINPRYFPARTWFAFQVLGPLRRWDEAAAQLGAALNMEPLSATANHHGAFVALQRRRPDEVIAYTRATLELDPGFVFAHLWRGMAYEMQARYDEAIAELEKGVQMLGPSLPGWQATLAHALARAGKRADAVTLLHELEQSSARRYLDPFWLGVVHAGLDEPDRAIDYIERAADDQSFHVIMNYPYVDRLRTHPRFTALMARMGLPAEPREPA